MYTPKPFCDIELNEVVCTQEEYDQIVDRMIANANRDLKFSDTEIRLSALDLHRYLNYRCYYHREDGFRLGVNAAISAVWRLGIKTALWLSVIGALVYAYYIWGA